MGPGGGIPKDSAGARGEGLEPSITGPEPVVLPITPPPNEWMTRLAEAIAGARRPAHGVGCVAETDIDCEDAASPNHRDGVALGGHPHGSKDDCRADGAWVGDHIPLGRSGTGRGVRTDH